MTSLIILPSNMLNTLKTILQKCPNMADKLNSLNYSFIYTYQFKNNKECFVYSKY